MNTLHIIRGLPGTGKSTLAKLLCGRHYREEDMYFVDPITGIYTYKKEDICHAHNWCRLEIENLLISGVRNVGVSNTFVKKWEYQGYLELATKYNYEVAITICTVEYGSVHDVPQSTIERMRKNFEL